MTDATDSHSTPCRRATDRLEASHTALVTTSPSKVACDDVVEAAPLRSTRHDPSFLTHLIAVAERCPQTRVLRRATPQDAMAAYRAADGNSHRAPAGITTCQNV